MSQSNGQTSCVQITCTACLFVLDTSRESVEAESPFNTVSASLRIVLDTSRESLRIGTESPSTIANCAGYIARISRKAESPISQCLRRSLLREHPRTLRPDHNVSEYLLRTHSNCQEDKFVPSFISMHCLYYLPVSDKNEVALKQPQKPTCSPN